MTLVEHLTELRRRIIVSVVSVVVAAIVVFFLYNRILHVLSTPYEHATRGFSSCPRRGCKLIFIGPLDAFAVRLKIAGYGGLALSIPVVMWETWRFVVPGLHRNERRYGFWFLLSGVVLFLLGCVVAWFTVEKALEFLLGVGGHSLQPFIAADKYLTLIMLMFAAFGVAFEFPVLLVFLMLVRVLSTRQLRSARRWAAVGITTFAAVITPSQDPFSLLFMAVPMYVFYEAAIVLGRVMKR